MCNVDDVVVFTLNRVAGFSGDGEYTYVWKWWDGTVTVTKGPTASKLINKGGTLSYSVIQSDKFGRSQLYSGNINVNEPPVVMGSPTVTENDAEFPFNTVLSSVSYDPDHPGGVELSFAWYNGATLISTGTTTVLSTGIYQNSLAVTVTEDQTLTQVITDTLNGVTRVNYFLRGYEPSGLQGSSSSISNSIISSANNLSQIIIGPGQQAIFTSYAQDTSPGQLKFVWSAGTNEGWSVPFSGTEFPSPLSTGLYRSQITKDVSSETPGFKTVNCVITNLTTEQSINVNSSVTLIEAQVPTITAISTDAPIINGGYAVSQAGYVHFSVTAADPNNALLYYQWTFTQPNISLFGRTVMLRPADYGVFDEAILVGNGTEPGTGPLPIIGQVTVTDRFGKSSTVSLNSFITTLVWPYTQVSPQTSGTGSTSLQKRYWGVAEDAAMEQGDLPLLNSDFSSARNLSETFNPLNQYVYLVYPSVFGPATINVNGTIASDWLLTVSTFNAVSYNVYRSAAPLTGVYQIVLN
jgi:hypothetical protein